MKKNLVFILCITISICAAAQQPVKWSYSAKKVADKMYEIHLTAILQNGWHTYSQSTPEGGPVPTKINFKKNPLTILTGSIKEDGKMVKKYEEVFGIDVKYFSNKVSFVQVIKLKSNVKTAVSGTIEYMVCTDEKCLPPATVPFTVMIN